MKIKIIHWSDFNCPYSYIGLKRLSDAADEMDLTPRWELKSFELPLSHKIDDDVGKIAEKDNLIIENVSLTSSRNAHRLAKFVQNRYPEHSQELIFKIFKANFSENRNISDIDVLTGIAESVGLEEEEIRGMLLKNSYNLEVELDTQDALFNGITAIPHYILHVDGQQLIVPGAFERQDFRIALEDLISGEIRYKSFL
jgi:predicted DsbA family dithiol-disulfide isomerase